MVVDASAQPRREGVMKFVFAGHEIDLNSRELRHGDETIHLEPQVYDILVHLVRHRDRVVSKDELLDTVWNGRIVSEAALSSRINAARKAIGDDGVRLPRQMWPGGRRRHLCRWSRSASRLSRCCRSPT